MKARLQKKYKEEVQKNLMEEFKYKNIMQVPKMEKIVVNTCLSEAIQNVIDRYDINEVAAIYKLMTTEQ